MDALLTSFVAAGLGEFGDRTQFLAALLAARFGRTGLVLAGIALGSLVNMALAAAAGSLVHDYILLGTAALLVAVAFLYAGATGVVGRKLPGDMAGSGKGPFWAAFAGAFVLEFADKSQFVTFAIAARTDAPLLTAAGATAGIAAACIPALVLGDKLATVLPLGPIRIGIAAAFLLAGAIVAVSALGLI